MSLRALRLLNRLKLNNNNLLTFNHLKNLDINFSDFHDLTINEIYMYNHYDKLIIDSDENFEFSLLFWHPNGFSKLHNHDGRHCIFRVLQGNLKEIKISNDEKYSLTRISENETVEINGEDYHQVINETEEEVITFNIYKKN